MKIIKIIIIVIVVYIASTFIGTIPIRQDRPSVALCTFGHEVLFNPIVKPASFLIINIYYGFLKNNNILEPCYPFIYVIFSLVLDILYLIFISILIEKIINKIVQSKKIE